MLRAYLAGAIRDNQKEDIEWREMMIDTLHSEIAFLNPVGGKTFDSTTRIWTMSGVVSTASAIVAHDFWCVDRADLVIFNFRALSQGYPSIGTLVEFGHATACNPRPLIYSIIEPDYIGHGNPGNFKLHPFLEKNSAIVFPTVDDCLKFLQRHVAVLDGRAPHFAGAA